jgi:protein phosphatase 1 regulatory subunit 37
MCRDILNTCIRNTEEAERNAHTSSANGSSGRGQGKGVWGMIEESKLAKTFRKDEDKKVVSRSPREPLEPLLISEGAQNEDETVAQARQCKEQLEQLLGHSTPALRKRHESDAKADAEVIGRTKALLPLLAEIVRTSSDSTRLGDLHSLTDTLKSLIARASPKPRISLQGLAIDLNGLRASPSSDGSSTVVTTGGDIEELTDEDVLSTPRLDKGKGKAPPELEAVEPILSPTNFTVADSDSEEMEHEVVQGEDDARSPTDR